MAPRIIGYWLLFAVLMMVALIVPAAEPTTTTTTTMVPATVPVRSVEERCAAAAQTVDDAGVHTAPGFEFRCPALALDENGVPHWGITCYYFVGKCADGANYIEINPSKI